MTCSGCGVELDQTQEQVNSLGSRVLDPSLHGAANTGGICPLCGRSKTSAYARRKRIVIGFLKVLLLVGTAVEIAFYVSRTTERASLMRAAVDRMNADPAVVQLLGKPIKAESGVEGEVRHDETGWREARLMIPIRGPKGKAVARVIAGRGKGRWNFTTFEVVSEQQHKKLDLISGRVVEYDALDYVETHTHAVIPPEYRNAPTAEPRLVGQHPCVFADVREDNIVAPQLGKCSTPTEHKGAVDRFEVDLRYGSFILRQTDLYLADVFEVPLTRSYDSSDWVHSNPVHAFGKNSNHPYDIVPVGTRNPYTYQMILLEDGDFLYFDRISKGTGYADAVYQHTETSTRFYKATQSWNGNGWTMKLADGSEIRFPESYSAKNAAQGAPTEMRDVQGNILELHRDGRRNLQEIKTPHGHWIRFNYDDLSRIIRAEDDAEHWVRYSYNNDGLVAEAISSSGRERHYAYEGTLMTEISDENKKILLHNWYLPPGVLVKQRFGNSATYSYDYDWPANTYNSQSVTVIFQNGTAKNVRVADSVPEYVRNFHK
jgi:YD repeat-containing protein